MPTGYTTSFKLASVATLPLIEDPLEPPHVRLCARVIASNTKSGLCVVADPAASSPRTVIVDFNRVVLEGDVSPPKVKDLVMLFAEVAPITSEPRQVPPFRLGFLNAQPPDPSRMLVAKRLVRVEEGHGPGFDVQSWAKAVETVQSRLTPE
ncbi:hypothetical protein JCM3766R1_006996 [Sporobolomyces carnicolor]